MKHRIDHTGVKNLVNFVYCADLTYLAYVIVYIDIPYVQYNSRLCSTEIQSAAPDMNFKFF